MIDIKSALAILCAVLVGVSFVCSCLLGATLHKEAMAVSTVSSEIFLAMFVMLCITGKKGSK